MLILSRCFRATSLFEHGKSWGRTLSELLIGRKDWFSNRCVLTWKRKDTRCSRSLYQLVASMPRTSGIGHGLLPTVQTQGLKMCDGNGKTQFYPVGLLPTPCAQEGFNSGKGVAYVSKTGSIRMKNADGTSSRMGLDGVVKNMLPTPISSDYKNGANSARQGYAQQLNDTIACRIGETSRLNPRFVVEMMGFPTDWTELPFRNGEKNRSKPTAMR